MWHCETARRDLCGWHAAGRAKAVSAPTIPLPATRARPDVHDVALQKPACCACGLTGSALSVADGATHAGRFHIGYLCALPKHDRDGRPPTSGAGLAYDCHRCGP